MLLTNFKRFLLIIHCYLKTWSQNWLWIFQKALNGYPAQNWGDSFLIKLTVYFNAST